MSARFRYPLEPVCLAQQWEHDADLGELAACNARVGAQEAVIATLSGQLAGAAQQWAALTAGASGLALERLALLSRYGSEQAQRREQAQRTLTTLEQERDAVRARVLQSRRRLDGFGKHRATLAAAFVQARLVAEGKDADDQWNGRRTGVAP